MVKSRMAAGASLLALAVASQLAISAVPSAAAEHRAPGVHKHSRPVAVALRIQQASGSESASIEDGKAIFEAHCAVCHGDEAQGKIGPNITGKTASDIDHALATVSMMSSLKDSISESDRVAIAAYLQSLKK